MMNFTYEEKEIILESLLHTKSARAGGFQKTGDYDELMSFHKNIMDLERIIQMIREDLRYLDTTF
jgi:hypothetical protein